MDTVSLSEFKRNFGEYIASARFGHTVIAFEKEAPYCLLVHPSVLSDEERSQCGSIATTDFYRHSKQVAEEVSGGRRLLVTVRGNPVGCLVGPDLLARALAVR